MSLAKQCRVENIPQFLTKMFDMFGKMTIFFPKSSILMFRQNFPFETKSVKKSGLQLKKNDSITL